MACWRGNDVLVRRRPRVWPVVAAALFALAIPTVAGIYVLSVFVALIELLLLFFLPATDEAILEVFTK